MGAELKTAFLKLKGRIVQVYHEFWQWLLFKLTEHYLQTYGINLQTVIKGMTEISHLFLTQAKWKDKKKMLFLSS